jgi:NADH-quinone oxidoreductase subunit A
MLTAFLAAVVSMMGAAGTAAAVALYRRRVDPLQLDWAFTVPFTGGHEPTTHAWNRFHARFYPMALVLIAFEMEMMFMYPWAVVYVELGVMALAEMGVFLGLLSLGVLYAWREGALSWQ